MKVLIIQQKMIGDVLTSSILFESLRLKYPESKLYYLINAHTFPVVQNNPFIEHFIFFSKEAEINDTSLIKLVKSIKNQKFDIIIDVYSKLSSNIITLFSGAKTKISYHKWYTTFIYDENIKRKKNPSTIAGLAIENRFQLLEPLDINQTILKPKIYLTEKDVTNGKLYLDKKGLNFQKPIYMINVLGSGENKTYPFKYMAKVIDAIVKESNGQILFNYIPKQLKEAKIIFDLCKVETQNHIYFDAFAQHLRGFFSITYHCNALIGNEGGAINMAKALNINTFSIFSPWIDKSTWAVFEDHNNVSVHLKDFKPELYINKAEKNMKKNAFKLYEAFQPEFFIEKLKTFLK